VQRLLSSASSVDPGVIASAVYKVQGDSVSSQADLLAVEEPLEIRLVVGAGRQRRRIRVSVTMRTPGYDEELAAGFLFTEGILTSREQIERVHPCRGAGAGCGNVVIVELRPEVTIDLARLERHFYTTSSCGVCGKTSLAAVQVGVRHRPSAGPLLSPQVIARLPEQLRQVQTLFQCTGGLHAAALFDAEGELIRLREDVGRHNALDKLVGAALLAGEIPLGERILLVSGRASFELVQKAAVAGIPILAAVGAPSSLAVELAGDHGMTLLGFVREDHFNIYTGANRIHKSSQIPQR